MFGLHCPGHRAGRAAPVAGVVAFAGLLDLDNVGAQVGQHLRAPGAGQYPGEVKTLRWDRAPAVAGVAWVILVSRWVLLLIFPAGRGTVPHSPLRPLAPPGERGLNSPFGSALFNGRSQRTMASRNTGLSTGFC